MIGRLSCRASRLALAASPKLTVLSASCTTLTPSSATLRSRLIISTLVKPSAAFPNLSVISSVIRAISLMVKGNSSMSFFAVRVFIVCIRNADASKISMGEMDFARSALCGV